MNKLFKKIAILLCVIFIAPSVVGFLPSVQTVTRAEAAAAKAKVGITNKNVGILSTPEYVYVENGKKGATYTYASSDKKIATISKDGKITGVKKGTVKITVTETYKGKKTKLGTSAVNIVNSKLLAESLEIMAYSGWLPPIQYKNFKAAYTLESSDPSVAQINENGFIVGLKGGEATITVTETYNKVKRNLGSIQVTVLQSYISDENKKAELGVNSSYSASYKFVVNNYSWDAVYSYESSDSNIVSFKAETTEWGYTDTMAVGTGIGTATVTVYEEFDGQKREVGTVEVTVKEIPVTSLKIDPWYAQADGTVSLTYYLGEKNDFSLSYYLLKEPYDATTPLTFTSSDESIVKVDKDGFVEAAAAGTAVITAVCGDYSAKYNITVTAY